MSGKNVFERHRFVTFLVLWGCFLLGLLVLDILVTTGTAGIRRKSAAKHKIERNKINRACREKSPVYHHGFKPNCRVEGALWGEERFNIYTNSVGFRDKSIRTVDFKKHGRRVVLIGDSFTEGIGLGYEKTFAGLLAADLEPKGIEVLNAGVSSYAPSIYFARMKDLVDRGFDFDELIVFLDVSDIKDEADMYQLLADNTVRDRFPDSAATDEEPAKDAAVGDDGSGVATVKKRAMLRTAQRWWFKHSTLPSTASKAMRTLFRKKPNRYRVQLGVDKERGRWTVRPSVYEVYGKRGLREAAASMNLLAGLMKQHGKKMTVVVYPWPDQIFYGDANSIQLRYWEDWAKNASVGFYSLFELFIKEGADEAERVNMIRKYYIEGDVHWNKSGHSLVAGALKAAQLIRQ